MQYLLLNYDNEKRAEEGFDEEELHKWFGLAEEMKKAGAMLGGEALKPTSTATTVRRNGTSVVTTDGPYAETKEQLAGFYLIEARNIDEAVAWAKKMPHVAHGGSVEIRPIMKFDG
jgi:hypothetical protein